MSDAPSDNHESITGQNAEKDAEARPGRTASLVRNIFANWLWYVLVVISGFLLPRFIDRHQGRELLGLWDLGWSLQFYISLLALGVASAVNRYVARYRTVRDWDALSATVSSSLMLLVVSSAAGLVGAAAFVAFVPQMLPGSSPDVVTTGRWVVWILSITAAIQLPGSVFNSVITGYERFDLLNLIRGSRDALVLIIMIALLVAGFGIIALAWTILIGELLCNVAKLVVARRLCPHLRLSMKFCRRSVVGKMLRFGGKAVLQSLAQSGLYQANTILVSIFLGPASLAVYARQRALVMHTMRFVKQYAQVFIPASSALHVHGDTAALRRLVVQTTKYGLYVTLPLTILFLVMGRPLLNVWMGAEYEAPVVLAVLVLGHLLSMPQLGVFSILMGMGKHGLPALFELGSALLSVGLGIVLMAYYQMGMVGAAVAMAVPVALSGGIFMPAYACRVLGIAPWQYIRAVVPGPVLAGIPFAVCLLSARYLFAERDGPQLALGLTSGGLVLAIVYWRWVLPLTVKRRITDAPRSFRAWITADGVARAPTSGHGGSPP